MAYETTTKVLGGSNYAYGDSVLPAVAGKSYRITGYRISIANKVASTGEYVQLTCVNKADAQTFGFAVAWVAPGVANVQNVVQTFGDGGIITKPGDAVKVFYGDSAFAAKALADFGAVSVGLVYTEIDY